MFFKLLLKILICCLHLAQSTIDLNLAELQYLADHLHPEECRRLVASLHFTSYQEPKALETAEASVSKDIPCIRLLLHWNSQPGEGKGETHEVLQHRLRQMGRVDLADWLGKTVFHELGVELMDSINDPFRDVINLTEKRSYAVQPTLTPNNYKWVSTEWLAFDTVCWVLVIGLGILALIILCKATYILIQKRKRKRRLLPPKSYTTLDDEYSSDSEDQFDILQHYKS